MATRPDDSMPYWTGGRTAGWPDGRMAGRPDAKAAGRMAGRPDGWAAGWPGGRMAGWPQYELLIEQSNFAFLPIKKALWIGMGNGHSASNLLYQLDSNPLDC